MVNIPRFSAQISPISVPSMKNFQEEQNEQIYKSVSNMANTSMKIAENLYAEDQKYKATVQGAEDVKEKGLTPKDLPVPLTQAQKSYNESAINAFAAQYTVDTSLELTNLEDQNRDNPYEFLSKAQAYIDGASSDIPEHLKPSIVKPLEMNARSIYSSLLRRHLERGKNASKVTSLLSLDDMIRDATNTEDPEMQSVKVAQTVDFISRVGQAGDISPELAEKKVKELRMGIASQRLSNQLLVNQNDAKTINQIINMSMQGRTGIAAFDALSPEERHEATNNALRSVRNAKGYLGEVAEQAGKYVLNEASLQMYNDLAPKTELTPSVLKEISWGNKSFYKMMDDSINSVDNVNIPTLKIDIEEGISNGTIYEKDIIDAYDGGYISGKDAISSLNQIFSPLSKNKKKQSFVEFKSNLDLQMGDIFNSIGGMTQKNQKKEYIEKNMENFLSSEEKTDAEIAEYSDIISEKANKIFKQDNEYKTIHTSEWFRNMNGYDVSAIEEAVSKSTVNGSLDMKKLRGFLLEMTGNNEDTANKLYSDYLAVKNARRK